MAETGKASRRTRTMERVHEQKERHRQRGRIFRFSFATTGFVLIALGIALIPLPGPGWLIIAAGLGMLALEFDRAERLLDRVLANLERVGDEAAGASRTMQVLAVLVLLAAGAGLVAVAVLWDLPLLPV